MDAGLETIIAAETVLSRIDGAKGQLIIRGRAIEDLARTEEFESVIHILWTGFFDDLPNVSTLKTRLGAYRVEAFENLSDDFSRLAHHPPLEMVRAGLSLGNDGSDLDTALQAVARAGVLLAAHARLSRGETPIRPNAAHSHAEDIVAMMTGTPSSHLAKGLNAYLVTVAEHGLNASTFAARVVASTQAGLLSAIIGGISALKGPLHGGAPGPVLDMLDEIGHADKAQAWVSNALDRGERLMGFGHRVYRARDPRADALKRTVSHLPKTAGRLQIAEDVEQEILKALAIKKPGRTLETNVEYYTALLLEAIGFERTAFTAVFACGRMAGWVAHAQEQLATKRIVRPKSVYIGPSLAA